MIIESGGGGGGEGEAQGKESDMYPIHELGKRAIKL